MSEATCNLYNYTSEMASESNSEGGQLRKQALNIMHGTSHCNVHHPWPDHSATASDGPVFRVGDVS